MKKYTVRINDIILDELKKETGLKSVGAVLSEAVTLYKWAVDKSKEGYKIAWINDAKGEELILEVETFEKLFKKYYEGKKSKNSSIDLTELLKDYHGKDLHIAVTQNYSKVVGTGKTIEEAIEEAEKAGYNDPILIRLPSNNLGGRF